MKPGRVRIAWAFQCACRTDWRLPTWAHPHVRDRESAIVAGGSWLRRWSGDGRWKRRYPLAILQPDVARMTFASVQNRKKTPK